ncbi:glycosyltransferase involved in cell wall biosynthesis [Algoriphagus ratkowskyi]|uniref:Glycosyltransferase family 4 protein n=1 Tax=Algoriphagus ratkowskyi TaxID=57028 RepID=A0A2W7QLI7_9BACT|nr:glycosyltransferase family 4 protein [Algoriphagus ratkowskyi]PZX49313.1 glycosyltransferase involved in cell wall biosynthesis [Algoriphagus ratkowskyi]TXD75378.1 glycosyltransferase family 4 protein [Algoriphagus ratkowskyi]
MRIIYIHQYYKTPEEGGAVRSYHLAKGLVDAGHEVEMITGGANNGYDQRWIEGVKVHYLPVHYDQKFGFFKRILSFLSYVRQAKKLIKKLPRPDVLYVTSTPLTTGLLGLWAKKSLAIPYIFEVRDLWPQAPIETGAIRNPLLKRSLFSLEKKIYQHALSLVALSPGIADHLRKVTPIQKIHLIPNFSDLDQFFPMEKRADLLQKYELNNSLTVAYTGALGKVNAVEELLDLAEKAKKCGKDWQFLIMGSGSHEARLREIAAEKLLTQVHFIPFGSKEKVNEVLSLADLAWISFAHLPVLKTNSPNKFFDALAAGKAILVNHKGWVYDLVKTHQLGISCLPTKIDSAFAKLEKLELDPAELAIMGENSRKLAEQYFTKELAISHLSKVIDPSNTAPDSEDEFIILTG